MSNNKNITPSQQDVQKAFELLYEELNKAYWAASTIEDKDYLHGIIEIVSDILDQLDIADIKSRTQDFNALSQKVKDLNSRLDKLQQDIDTIIHAVNVATSVTNAIAQAIAVAAKFFPG